MHDRAGTHGYPSCPRNVRRCTDSRAPSCLHHRYISSIPVYQNIRSLASLRVWFYGLWVPLASLRDFLRVGGSNPQRPICANPQLNHPPYSREEEDFFVTAKGLRFALPRGSLPTTASRNPLPGGRASRSNAHTVSLKARFESLWCFSAVFSPSSIWVSGCLYIARLSTDYFIYGVETTFLRCGGAEHPRASTIGI